MNLYHLKAYYGSRVALPPYYNSAVASGHAPHPYMWGPPQVLLKALDGLYFSFKIASSFLFHLGRINEVNWDLITDIDFKLWILLAYDGSLWGTICSNLFTWRSVCTSGCSNCKSSFFQQLGCWCYSRSVTMLSNFENGWISDKQSFNRILKVVV